MKLWKWMSIYNSVSECIESLLHFQYCNVVNNSNLWYTVCHCIMCINKVGDKSKHPDLFKEKDDIFVLIISSTIWLLMLLTYHFGLAQDNFFTFVCCFYVQGHKLRQSLEWYKDPICSKNVFYCLPRPSVSIHAGIKPCLFTIYVAPLCQNMHTSYIFYAYEFHCAV